MLLIDISHSDINQSVCPICLLHDSIVKMAKHIYKILFCHLGANHSGFIRIKSFQNYTKVILNSSIKHTWGIKMCDVTYQNMPSPMTFSAPDRSVELKRTNISKCTAFITYQTVLKQSQVMSVLPSLMFYYS